MTSDCPQRPNPLARSRARARRASWRSTSSASLGASAQSAYGSSSNSRAFSVRAWAKRRSRSGPEKVRKGRSGALPGATRSPPRGRSGPTRRSPCPPAASRPHRHPGWTALTSPLTKPCEGPCGLRLCPGSGTAPRKPLLVLSDDLGSLAVVRIAGAALGLAQGPALASPRLTRNGPRSRARSGAARSRLGFTPLLAHTMALCHRPSPATSQNTRTG